MQAGTMDLVTLVVFGSWLAPALASAENADKDYDSAFEYDYESLRIGGLVFAVVLFVLGIVLIVTKKCSCSSDKPRPKTPDEETAVPIAQ
ncbi:sodium/potassium-transporting ATPase subunit gamma-like isoform X4 [Gymnodraco acuticeps]|uniref:FXYD domain-containing ion transport regulator n=2 Tax=Gymnodraco acuticeps TaxID=8218 RepID=A0A6P8V1P9_GYMAC|nr:sodium/potassium-transporting ATPase subunit gamma-like isoform X4 [Gymnodraco acuticeps]